MNNEQMHNVLEAIIQFGCHHSLERIVEASVATCEDSGVTLSVETEKRYDILVLKTAVMRFTYKDGGLTILEILSSFRKLVSTLVTLNLESRLGIHFHFILHLHLPVDFVSDRFRVRVTIVMLFSCDLF